MSHEEQKAQDPDLTEERQQAYIRRETVTEPISTRRILFVTLCRGLLH